MPSARPPRRLRATSSAFRMSRSDSGTTERSRRSKRVFEKLHEEDLSVLDLREERERRGDIHAGLASAIRERAEHRNLVSLLENITNLEGLGLPRTSHSFECANDRFGPRVRPGPRQVALERGIVSV